MLMCCEPAGVVYNRQTELLAPVSILFLMAAADEHMESQEHQEDISDADDAGDHRRFTVTTQQVITYGKNKIFVPEQKHEDGLAWIYLSKWDRQLVLFVHEKPLDLSKKNKHGVSLDTPFFEDMLSNRQKAFNAVLQERLRDDEEKEEPARKKSKSFKAIVSKHGNFAPHHVDMQLPAVDGVEMTAKVLWHGMATRGIWLEMTEQVIQHVRKGLQQSAPKNRVKKKVRRS